MAQGLQLNSATGNDGEASEQRNNIFIAPAPISQKSGDQPQCDHRGADLSITALIPNPSLQSELSGFIGVPLHSLKEINSGSPQSLPHQKSCGLALVLMVIIALLCLFRDNKVSGCGEEERQTEWNVGKPSHSAPQFSGGTSNLCRADFINNHAQRPAHFDALTSPPAA